MFGKDWSTSGRRFDVARERDVRIPTSAGIHIDCDIVRPVENGRFPVILGVHAYSKEDQFAQLMPIGMNHRTAHIEAGDSEFFARRGYIHVVANIRGTGQSEGMFGNFDAGSVQDIADVIEWLARQPWSSGAVGMYGMSYFSIIQQRVAALNPPSLKCIFAPYGWNDAYRDRYYHGGILSWRFMHGWIPSLSNPRFRENFREAIGDVAFEQSIQQALSDPSIGAIPFLRNSLLSPREGSNIHISEILANPLDGPYFRERSIDFSSRIGVPAYLGGCWGVYGLHLPGAFRAFEHWGARCKLTIGPPLYLDRPIYQYANEAIRWFDHWLKGNDTGMLDEPPVQLFVDGTGRWRSSDSWPLRETRWTEFYLHENGLLSEHEFWQNEQGTSFADSPYERGSAVFTTPTLVEETEICGPIILRLFGSTTGDEILWFVSLWEVDEAGKERLLTRGWLRGSQRALDHEKSKPWQPVHLHTKREPLKPNEIYPFDIEVRPYAIRLKPGMRLRLKVRTADDEVPENDLQSVSVGHVTGSWSERVTIHHNANNPSCLVLPIVEGNRIGTFMSGGRSVLTGS